MFASIFVLALVAQRVVSQSTSISPASVCQLIEEDVSSCWSNTNVAITATEVASCICTNGNGGVTTAFDDAVPLCYPYAASVSAGLGSAIAAFSGYCASYAIGVGGGAGLATGASTTTGPKTVATGLASECQEIISGIGECLTNTQLSFTDPAVATCLCSDSTDANFGQTLDGAVSTCYSYYRSVSADTTTLGAFSALQGYCGSYYTAGGSQPMNTGLGTATALTTGAVSIHSSIASQASNSEENTSLVVIQPSETSTNNPATTALINLTSAGSASNAASHSSAASILTSAAKTTTTSSGNSGGTIGGKSESSIFSINVGPILFTAAASILILALAL